MLKIKKHCTVRNDKYDTNGKEVNVILKKKCNYKTLNFVDNGNINPRMLNKSRLYKNEYGIAKLVNNFCYTIKKGRDKIRLDNDCRSKRNYSGSPNIERPVISKRRLEKNLNDANCSFENKVCSNAFQPVQKQVAKP